MRTRAADRERKREAAEWAICPYCLKRYHWDNRQPPPTCGAWHCLKMHALRQRLPPIVVAKCDRQTRLQVDNAQQSL